MRKAKRLKSKVRLEPEQTSQFLSSIFRSYSLKLKHEESKSKDLLNPPNTVRAVLCYIRRGDDYLLLLKSKGRFGEGYWNAPGGKIERSETPQETAKREVREETGLLVTSLKYAGFLKFYFGPNKKRPDWTAVVFKTSSFSGKLKKSEEGELRWFSKSSMPYGNMWEDDRYWLPILISGGKFRGTFEFTQDSKSIVKSKVIRL